MPRGLLLSVFGWSRESFAALGVVRSLQLVALSPALMRSVLCTLSILPSVMMMVLFVFVVHYFFSVLALEVLGSQVVSFSTVPKAFATMLQLLLEVDFKDTLEEAVIATHPAVGAIFLAYYALAVMVVLNLITALMIEFYRERLTQAVEDTEQKRADLARTVQAQFHGDLVEECLRDGRQLTTEESMLREEFLEAQNVFDEKLLSGASAEFQSRDASRSPEGRTRSSVASICLLALHREKTRAGLELRASGASGDPIESVRPRAKSNISSIFGARMVSHTSFNVPPDG